MHLQMLGHPQRLYVEEAGQGIPLLCLHTAGSDGRQYRGVMNEPRVTNPIDWAHSSPVRWENQAIGTTPPAHLGIAGYGQSLNTTLPTISLILGIISCFLVCCAGGIWLGLPAAIVGYIALKSVESNPTIYGGRGMAIGGMVLGIVTFLASVFFLIFGQLS